MANIISGTDYIGKRLSWDNIEGLFPDNAIVYSNPIYLDKNIKSLDNSTVIIHGVFELDDDECFDLIDSIEEIGVIGLGYTGSDVGGVITCFKSE